MIPIALARKAYLPVIVMAAFCAPVFLAWLVPRNIATWLLTMSFCG